MIDISKGRYWDLPWSLVSGCTPCSPGCERCWSAAMSKRFHSGAFRDSPLTINGKFNGRIVTHRERLSIPLKRRKPTVYAIWNDLFHEAVPDVFIADAFRIMEQASRHTFLVLTKRPQRMHDFFSSGDPAWPSMPSINVWSGLTVCNQEEADAKIPVFMKVPGKKYLSIEPMLGAIDLKKPWTMWAFYQMRSGYNIPRPAEAIGQVILGGETGAGARPMHPDWVRSVRDQCAAAGVPFMFKGWGAWKGSADFKGAEMVPGTERKGRLLDGRTHDDVPWR